MYDPEYVNYKLKKTFDEVWGPGGATSPTTAAPADKK
jgi:hypothetical protein